MNLFITYCTIELINNLIKLIHYCSDLLKNLISMVHYSLVLNNGLENIVIVLITVIAASISLIFLTSRLGKAAKTLLGTIAAGTTIASQGPEALRNIRDMTKEVRKSLEENKNSDSNTNSNSCASSNSNSGASSNSNSNSGSSSNSNSNSNSSNSGNKN